MPPVPGIPLLHYSWHTFCFPTTLRRVVNAPIEPLRHSGFPYAFVAVALTPPLLLIWTFLLPVAPGPSFMETPATIGTGLGLLGLPLIVVFYPVFILIRLGLAYMPGQSALKTAHLTSLYSLCFGAAAMTLLYLPVQHARKWAVTATAARAEPVINALERYHESHGRYPDALSDLVPGQLAEVPSTGMMGDSTWRYAVKPEGKDFIWRDSNGGRSPAYDLHARCTLPMRWDSLHYWPTTDYPQDMRGGPVERMGKWAYVHE